MYPTLGCSSFLRWNSSCSSLKRLNNIAVFKSTIVWKCQKSRTGRGDNKGSQHIPKHVMRGGGTISVSAHTTKKGNRVTGITQNTHKRARSHGRWAHARTLCHTGTTPRLAYIRMHCWEGTHHVSLRRPPHSRVQSRRLPFISLQTGQWFFLLLFQTIYLYYNSSKRPSV